VAAHRRSDDAVVATVLTDNASIYTLLVPTSGVPFDGYLRTEYAPYVPARFYPSRPFFDDWDPFARRNIPLFMSPWSVYQSMAGGAGVTLNPTKGILYIMIAECSERSLEGATASLSPTSGTLLYTDGDGDPDPSIAATGNLGDVWVYNVDPGDVVLSAEYLGIPLDAPAVHVAAGEVTLVFVRP
jgi:hypothetical protein